jgi:ketosteroid isomerase-like protein
MGGTLKILARSLACSVVLVTVIASCASGVARSVERVDVASDEAALRALEDTWAAAYVAHDSAALATTLAEDFVMSRGRSEVWTKADYLRHVANDTLHHASITRADERIRLYGDAAVVTYRPTRLTEGRAWVYRSTDTFIRRDRRWRLVARHISEVQ